MSEKPPINRFHDAHFTAISLGTQTATLGLREEAGGRYELHLRGVEALNIESFREGNIILYLRLLSGADAMSAELEPDDLEEVMEVLFPGPHPSAASPFHEEHAAIIRQKVRDLEEGNRTLVVLDPAYGADLVAYCAATELVGPL
jgi:hypothetical protein